MLNDNTNEYVVDEIETVSETQASAMLTDWTEAKTASFQKEIMGFGHNLNQTGLFTRWMFAQWARLIIQSIRIVSGRVILGAFQERPF